MLRRLSVFYRLLALSLLGGALAGYAELNTWTSSSGFQVNARFIDMDNDQVVLQSAEGRELKIRITLLIPADQVRARNLFAESGPDEASDGDLPLLTRGPGRGHHAYYTHQNFDAWVTKNGRLFIHPKENGQRVGRPFQIQHEPVILTDDHGLAILQRITKSGPPEQEPRSITFEALAKRDDVEITYKVEYTFNQNRICASSEIIEPRRSDLLIEARADVQFQGAEDIPEEMPRAERVKLLEKHLLRWRGGEARRWQELTFYASTTFSGPVDVAEISGPWGQRVVKLKGENRRSGNRAAFWTYGGQPLNEGYRFYFRVEKGSQAGTSCVTID